MEAVMAIETGGVREAPDAGRRSAFGRTDSPLARAIARAPVSVQTKLLVGFAFIAALLVLVGVLGLVALKDSNARVRRLGALQARAAEYAALQSDVAQLKSLLAQRAGSTPNAGVPLGRNPHVDPGSYFFLDAIISQWSESFHSDATVLEGSEPALFRRVSEAHTQLLSLARTVTARDLANDGDKVGPLVRREARIVDKLAPDIDALAARASDQTQALVIQNGRSFNRSRNVFISVAAGSVVLALLLGVLLSWSLTAPLRRTQVRLGEIAEGDFTHYVDVPNRDEVGVLAANVNRMNDELERLYRELETASRHKSDFLATMSHELRTPLNAIIGFSEVLQEQMFGELNTQQLAYVDDVLAAGRHLLALINDVLDLAKIESGRMELDLGPVPVADVLQSGMTMHGERASRAGIALGLSVDPEDLVVIADERRMRQVVFNLLSNAVKFTPSNGRIDVTAAQRDGVVEIAVSDTGPGIAPEDRDRIFEEFDQGSAVQRVEGTGLGLSLSRKFVELHGGRLWVESTSGVGSTFRFTLPVDQEAAT
jgi:signal transduction histidine kinase